MSQMSIKSDKLDDQRDRPDLKRFFAHRVREAILRSKHLKNTSGPRLIGFPCEHWDACSGMLWGKGALGELKAKGWDIVLTPPQLELVQRKRLCRSLKPDAIFFIKARDWKNHPRHYPDIPLIFIIDDADFLDPNERDHVIACTKAAALVIAGNEFVASWCRQHNPNVEKIWVPHPTRSSSIITPNAKRKNIILWAPKNPVGYIQESKFISDVICKLRESRSDFEFQMTGCANKAWADSFAEPLLAADVDLKQFGYFKEYADYLSILASAAIGIHPVKIENEYARGKSFGKSLSYISASAVVVTDPVPDHSDFFRHKSNAMVANTVEEYAESISYLLDHPAERQAMAEQAYTDFLIQLATPVAAKKLEAAILKAIQ